MKKKPVIEENPIEDCFPKPSPLDLNATREEIFYLYDVKDRAAKIAHDADALYNEASAKLKVIELAFQQALDQIP